MKKIQDHITLLLPDGKISVPILIQYDDGENACGKVEITLIYNGLLYQGKGTDCLWADAFADLQRKLPRDVQLGCCMTCAHGNTCPYGNEVNTLFCTKDIAITSKEDMLYLFDRTDPYAERAVSSIHYCEHFIYQSEDRYTYNDYFYLLKNNR